MGTRRRLISTFTRVMWKAGARWPSSGGARTAWCTMVSSVLGSVRPGRVGTARIGSRKLLALLLQYGGRTSLPQRAGMRCRSGQRIKAHGALRRESSGSCWPQGAALTGPQLTVAWGRGWHSCWVSRRACRPSSGKNHQGVRRSEPGGHVRGLSRCAPDRRFKNIMPLHLLTRCF